MKTVLWLVIGGAVMIALHAFGFYWLEALGVWGWARVLIDVFAILLLSIAMAEVTGGNSEDAAVCSVFFPAIGFAAALGHSRFELGLEKWSDGAVIFAPMSIYLIVFYVIAFQHPLFWAAMSAVTVMLLQVSVGAAIPRRAF